MYAIYAGEMVEDKPQLNYINSFENADEAVSEAKRLKNTYGQIELINEASKELIWNYSSEDETINSETA